MSRSRSYRRQQRQKALARAYAKAALFLIEGSGKEKWVRRSAITPHPCSGHCCGNPRRHASGAEALTMQERRAPDVEF